MTERFIPKKESEFAKECISKLRNREFDYIKSLTSQEIISQVDDDLLLKMADLFRDGKLISTELIGSHVNIFNGEWQGNFSFEYEFESGWNLANVALRKTNNNGYEIIGLNVYQSMASQRDINKFSLSSKSVIHYIILILIIIIPLFICVTIFICAKTPNIKKKWLWIIFIMCGVVRLKINWTSGQYIIQLISVYLFGFSFQKTGPYAPWILSVSLPLGAIIFWMKRKQINDQTLLDSNSEIIDNSKKEDF